MKKFLTVLLIGLILCNYTKADEGMWIPILLNKYNFKDMQQKGFKLTAEDIYSVNNASMKDAIVIFGRGCTGELISDKGLLITNHHCGYGTIQKHSSLEHDYLKDGFWAMSEEEELVNPGLTATFLISMKDVTNDVLKGVDDSMSEADRKNIIEKNIEELKELAEKNTHYKARIEKFYQGNQYFMFINEVFTDVRLVGAPPSAIGKFGGDTDNWMWPRHTGDFSLFRIYADKDGKPAKYSKDNVPLKPKKYFPISLKGVKEGDFTMVFGYPGTTKEYLPSFAVEKIINETDPLRISIRDKKLEIINEAMNSDALIRIQYSAKAASIANGWKKWIGEIRGLKRLDAINIKKEYEKRFTEWVNKDSNRQKKYGTILKEYETIYSKMSKYNKAMINIQEAGLGSDAILLAIHMRMLENLNGADDKKVETIKENAKKTGENMFKDYNEATDKKIFTEMMKIYHQNVPEEFYPEYFKNFNKITKKSTDKYASFADYCFDKSVFTNSQKFEKFTDKLSQKSYKTVMKDPIYLLMTGFLDIYVNKLNTEYSNLENQIDSLNRIYMKAQMEFEADRLFYPDANFTLRVTYGNIKKYFPKDGVKYNYFTTLDGIIEKDNPEIYDYDVPDKLKELYNNKDYGQYADADGTIHVGFIATNHTTGGNSGSPVINAYGELIGVNFDRNWEGTMSDIMYDPEMCRNITLDIRYALFIIDKYANAKHLINEMDIRK